MVCKPLWKAEPPLWGYIHVIRENIADLCILGRDYLTSELLTFIIGYLHGCEQLPQKPLMCCNTLK